MLISHLDMTDYVLSSPQISLYSEFSSREFQFLKAPSLMPFLLVRAIFILWCIAYYDSWCPNSLLYWARNVVLC